jgi:hypothetical protein
VQKGFPVLSIDRILDTPAAAVVLTTIHCLPDFAQDFSSRTGIEVFSGERKTTEFIQQTISLPPIPEKGFTFWFCGIV